MTVEGNKILIVDEQEGICALLSEYLQREGMIPVVAHTGAVALEKIRTELARLVDRGSGSCRTWTACRRCRRRRPWTKISLRFW